LFDPWTIQKYVVWLRKVVRDYNPSISEARQEDYEFEASLDYIERPYLKKQNKTQQKPQMQIKMCIC
jgi:hypothetical protein